MYQWLLFGHVLGAFILVAGFSLYVGSIDFLARATTQAQLRTMVALAQRGESLLIAGGIVLIPFGLILALRYWSLSLGWIVSAIGLVLLQGAMGSLIVDRRVRRLHVSLQSNRDADGGVADEIAILRSDRVMLAANRASAASLIELVFLMTVKPAGEGLAVSLLVAVAAAVVLGATATRMNRPELVQH
jgi:hypothetical protein